MTQDVDPDFQQKGTPNDTDQRDSSVDAIDVRRRRLLEASVGAAGFSMVGVEASGAENPPNSRERPDGVEAKPVEPKDNGSHVLIIKNCEPWTEPANERVLNELGEHFQVINSDMLADHDLSQHVVVIIPSTQTQSYYDNLAASKAKLADFVSNGGALIAHITDDGWPCTTRWSESFLPKGVNKVTDYEEHLTILDGSHPVVSAISDADLDGWNLSTHGYLTELPDSATSVIGVEGNAASQPTYVEYEHGSGTVLATMQTLEWPWGPGKDDVPDLGAARNLLRNELDYALSVSESPEAILQLKEDTVRLVQTVEDTHTTEVGYQEPDPDIVGGRQASIAFDLTGSNLDQLSDTITVIVRRHLKNTEDPLSDLFTLTKKDIKDVVNDTRSPIAVFDDNSDIPIFEIKEELDSVTIEIRFDSGKDSYTLNSGTDFDIAHRRRLRVGFIPLKDPEAGERYGVDGEGTPANYEATVSQFCDYLKKIFPVWQLDVYRHDTPVEGTSEMVNGERVAVSADATHAHTHDQTIPEDESADKQDLQRARDALEDQLPIFADRMLCGATVNDFDVTVAIAPGADENAENDEYFAFHGGINPRTFGYNLAGTSLPLPNTTQPQASVVVLDADSNLPELDDQGNHERYLSFDDIVGDGARHIGAQEMGHHFLEEPYQGPDDENHPLAQRDDEPGGLFDSENLDLDHARNLNSDHDNDGNEDAPGVVSTSFDFTDGEFTAFVADTDGDGVTDTVQRRESFMSYTDDAVWTDARSYQELINSRFDPHPPEAAGSHTGEENPKVLSGVGTVENNGTIQVRHLYKRIGHPTPNTEDGEVEVSILNSYGVSLDHRKIGKKVIKTHADRGDDSSYTVTEGIVMFVIPFPDKAAEIHMEQDNTVTKINPIEDAIRAAVERLPNSGFINRPQERKQSLFNKLAAVDNQMEENNFRGAKEMMQQDIRDKIEKWLEEKYTVTALQPTKHEMLNLVDDMIARLETLAQSSS